MAEEVIDEIHQGHGFEVVEHDVHVVHSSKREIWKVFFILLGITLLEFLIALTHSIRDALGRGPVVAVFLFLTAMLCAPGVLSILPSTLPVLKLKTCT
jgi:hypothetical protein